MLNLTPKHNEVICIGRDIKVQIIRLPDGGVSLGIQAPREIQIYREKVTEQKAGQQK
jgi:carbon storage regulator CsrA